MWRGNYFLNLLVFVLLATPAFGQEASGRLSNTQRWQGEITITGSVTVPADVTLSIAPGARIRVTRPETTLAVSGTLLAKGTAEKPIVFTAPAGWQGIQFLEPTGVSELEHLRIDGVVTAISSIAAKFSVRSCSFTGNGTAIKLLRESYPLVEDSRFVENAIAIDNEMKSVILVRRNQFIGQKKSAIIASHNSSGPILDNHFEKNKQAIVLMQKYPDRIENNHFVANSTGIFCNQTQTTPQIKNNLFEKNENALINFTFAYPQIEDNRFLDNGTAIRNDQFGSPQIRHNLFKGNKTAIFNDRRSDPAVEFNQFEHNEVVFYCEHSSYPLIRNNNLINSRMAVQIGPFQSAEFEQRTGSKQIVQQKSMAQNSRNPLIKGAPTEFRDYVDISGNWWGDDTPRLQQATDESNLDLFDDRLDKRTTLYEGYGYLRDRVLFQPCLEQAVADTLPREAP